MTAGDVRGQGDGRERVCFFRDSLLRLSFFIDPFVTVRITIQSVCWVGNGDVVEALR